MIPGINDAICLGPRIGLFEPKEITLTKKDGYSFGYNNGVDVRLLNPFQIPLIQDDTEIGVHDGATVRHDGVEFGHQRRIFKLWRDNTGGVVEWGPRGVGVDVGYRGSAADLVGIQYTVAGVTVGNPSQGLAAPPMIPGPRVPSPTSLYRPSNIARLYPGGRIQPDLDSFYRQKFRNFGGFRENEKCFADYSVTFQETNIVHPKKELVLGVSPLH